MSEKHEVNEVTSDSGDGLTYVHHLRATFLFFGFKTRCHELFLVKAWLHN